MPQGLSNIQSEPAYMRQHVLYEPRHKKTYLWDFLTGPTQLSCTATESGPRFEISDIESRGIILTV